VLSKLFKVKVEDYYHHVKKTNPLFENTRKGKITEKEIGAYLVNILYLIRHTPIYLTYAKKKAEQRGEMEIAKFFQSKFGEESGHDKWAEKDLSQLKESFSHIPENNITPDMKELVDYLRDIIDRDPALYIAYIFLAEYFTVLLGPSWLNDLEEKCGIPRSMMSVIGNHVELDKGHVLEDIRQIDSLLGDVADPQPFLDVLSKATLLHERFCAEVGKVK
jgi:hypothetical protein